MLRCARVSETEEMCMAARAVRFVGRWPFLTLGLATFALFLLGEAIEGFGWMVAPVLRVLILPLLFLPHVLADLALAHLRRQL